MEELSQLQEQLVSTLQILYDTEALSPLMEFCQGEMRVLFYLTAHENQKVYPSQLSEALAVTRQRITTILTSMRKKNMILMEVEELDRRRMSIVLTDTGRAIAEEKRRGAYSYLGQLVRYLGEENTREFIRLMQLSSKAVKEISPVLKGADTHEF